MASLLLAHDRSNASSFGKHPPIPKISLPPHGLHVARTSPVKRASKDELTRPIKKTLAFSSSPSDLEIFNARVFFEPLVPVDDNVSLAENKQLSDALIAFKTKHNPEDISDLIGFLGSHPNSRWCASLEAALAQQRFETGYLSDAIKYWTSSWNSTKSQRNQKAKAVADDAISRLVIMEARLGLAQDLKQHLSEIANRRINGSVEQRVKDARDGIWSMKHHPEISFKCGPYAVNTLGKPRKSQASCRYQRNN